MKNGERPTDVYEMENDPATRNQRLAAVQVNHTKLVAAMREKGLTSAQLEALRIGRIKAADTTRGRKKTGKQSIAALQINAAKAREAKARISQ